MPNRQLLHDQLADADTVPAWLLRLRDCPHFDYMQRPLRWRVLWLDDWADCIHVHSAVQRGSLWPRHNGAHGGNLRRPLQRRLLLQRWVGVGDAVCVRRGLVLPLRHHVRDPVPLPHGHVLARRRVLHGAGLVHCVPSWIVRRHDGAHDLCVHRALYSRLLLQRGQHNRDAVCVPVRPLLPVGHVFGDAVPLPRGFVLARRRVLHGAGLVHSVPGRHLREHNGAHDCCVHRRVPDWLLLPPQLNLRDADHLPGGLFLPRGRRRADGLLLPVRVLGHGPDR